MSGLLDDKYFYFIEKKKLEANLVLKNNPKHSICNATIYTPKVFGDIFHLWLLQTGILKTCT